LVLLWVRLAEVARESDSTASVGVEVLDEFNEEEGLVLAVPDLALIFLVLAGGFTGLFAQALLGSAKMLVISKIQLMPMRWFSGSLNFVILPNIFKTVYHLSKISLKLHVDMRESVYISPFRVGESKGFTKGSLLSSGWRRTI
jgi:hypothetical protein